MKRLTYQRVKEIYYQKQNPNSMNPIESILETLVDSINECIDNDKNSLKEKVVKFKEDRIKLGISKDQVGICLSDNGGDLLILTCNQTVIVKRDEVYLSDEK